MKHEHSAMQALRGYHIAARTAKVLRVAHFVALGCAAASLAVGGARVVKKFREG